MYIVYRKNCRKSQNPFWIEISKEFVNISVTTENNLVCKNGWIDELLTVAAMVGMIIGPTVSGMVSDRIGRIMSIVLFCFISFGFALVNGCLGSYHWVSINYRLNHLACWIHDATELDVNSNTFKGIYGVFRLLSVFGSSGIGITYFVVIMESIGDRYRPRLGLLYITTTIGVGTVLLSFITMALRKWQHVSRGVLESGLVRMHDLGPICPSRFLLYHRIFDKNDHGDSTLALRSW